MTDLEEQISLLEEQKMELAYENQAGRGQPKVFFFFVQVRLGGSCWFFFFQVRLGGSCSFFFLLPLFVPPVGFADQSQEPRKRVACC